MAATNYCSHSSLTDRHFELAVVAAGLLPEPNISSTGFESGPDDLCLSFDLHERGLRLFPFQRQTSWLELAKFVQKRSSE